MKIARKSLLTLCFAALCCLAPLSFAQTPAATPTAAPKAITDADLAGAPVPSADARSKGDPDGALTGTASDIAVTDAKKGATIGDLANQVGQNKIAINLLYGPGSGAFALTMTPTYRKDAFFLRGEFSIVHATSSTPGSVFGPAGLNVNQPRGLVEAGFMF